ncbi:hypothetical protein ACFL2Q_15015 [Thermodesulfobacteriota bacterium]
MKRARKQEEQKRTPTEPEDRVFDLPEWLSDEAATLREMVEWWKSRESAAMEGSVRRPVFEGKTKNSGIRVNEEIMARALHKARQEKLKTGGNLSQLVEWLMWVYIGRPTDVVEGPPEGA